MCLRMSTRLHVQVPKIHTSIYLEDNSREFNSHDILKHN